MTEIHLKDIEWKKYYGLVKGVEDLADHLYDLKFTQKEVIGFIVPMINSIIVHSGNRSKK